MSRRPPGGCNLTGARFAPNCELCGRTLGGGCVPWEDMGKPPEAAWIRLGPSFARLWWQEYRRAKAARGDT